MACRMGHHGVQCPPSSSTSLPPLASSLAHRLTSGHVEFPINEECTSLALVPSGRHMVAGFTDGTLRLFDLTGKFKWQDDLSLNRPKKVYDSETNNLFNSDSSSEEENHFDDDDEDENRTKSTFASSASFSSGGGGSMLVCSKSHQRYGAVVCQIHAKGVHTSLQMTVDVSPDGLYAFGGVARGSMELVAVDLSAIETYADEYGLTTGSATTMPNSRLDLLDLAHVHRHADAKLRGFGACTRLQRRGTQSEHGLAEPTYILLTGKGIKNIHIWSFQPRRELWQCLYDTQTNGNSISMLHLRYTSAGSLEAISKCDSQKLRVWDLSYEQEERSQLEVKTNQNRPKRPPYLDLSGTETTLGIGGDFGFGGCLYEQISLVNLNVEPPYNVTELLLPGRSGNARRPLGARQQRGEMQALQKVAGMPMDGSHVLLEMSDFSVVHFFFEGSAPRLEMLGNCGNESESRALCVARIGSSGITVAAMASGRKIKLRQIGGKSLEGYWGFHGVAASRTTISSSCADSEATAIGARTSAVGLFAQKQNSNFGDSSCASSSAFEEESVSSTITPFSDATDSYPGKALASLRTPILGSKSSANVSTSSTDFDVSPSTLPDSAIKALNSNTLVAKSMKSLRRKVGRVTVSPESVPYQARVATEERKAFIPRKESGHNVSSEKLMLHIRIPKATNFSVKRHDSEASVDSSELDSIKSLATASTFSDEGLVSKTMLHNPFTIAVKPSKQDKTKTKFQAVVLRDSGLEPFPAINTGKSSVNVVVKTISKRKSCLPQTDQPSLKRAIKNEYKAATSESAIKRFPSPNLVESQMHSILQSIPKKKSRMNQDIPAVRSNAEKSGGLIMLAIASSDAAENPKNCAMTEDAERAFLAPANEVRTHINSHQSKGEHPLLSKATTAIINLGSSIATENLSLATNCEETTVVVAAVESLAFPSESASQEVGNFAAVKSEMLVQTSDEGTPLKTESSASNSGSGELGVCLAKVLTTDVEVLLSTSKATQNKKLELSKEITVSKVETMAPKDAVFRFHAVASESKLPDPTTLNETRVNERASDPKIDDTNLTEVTVATAITSIPSSKATTTPIVKRKRGRPKSTPTLERMAENGPKAVPLSQKLGVLADVALESTAPVPNPSMNTTVNNEILLPEIGDKKHLGVTHVTAISSFSSLKASSKLVRKKKRSHSNAVSDLGRRVVTPPKAASPRQTLKTAAGAALESNETEPTPSYDNMEDVDGLDRGPVRSTVTDVTFATGISTFPSFKAKKKAILREKQALLRTPVGPDSPLDTVSVSSTSCSRSVTESSLKSPRLAGSRKRGSTSLKRPVEATLNLPPKKCRRVIDAYLGNVNSANIGVPLGFQTSSLPFDFGEATSETECCRMKLALDHRAAHEMLRNKVLQAVPELVRCMSSQEGASNMEDIKSVLEGVINDYTEFLNDLLFRQEMEVSALAAALFLPFIPVVSFPFPEVFDQARKAMSVAIESRLCSN